jgi:nicotinamide-nucleotide adenylyltransferase
MLEQDKKYKCGLAVMRVQPFHNGHKFLIDGMLDESDIAVVAIGSSQESDTVENPFSYDFRRECISLTYPVEVKQGKLRIIGIEDIFNSGKWVEHVLTQVQKQLGLSPDVYICGGVDNGKYFQDENMRVKNFKRDTNDHISGTEIRELIKNPAMPLLNTHLPFGTRKMLEQIRCKLVA